MARPSATGTCRGERYEAISPCLLVCHGRYFLALDLHAQLDRGEIPGFVRDPSNAPVTGVTLTVRSENTGLETRILTNETGYYQAPNLVSGRYTVEVGRWSSSTCRFSLTSRGRPSTGTRETGERRTNPSADSISQVAPHNPLG